VVREFLPAAPRPDGTQEAPPSNQIETLRGLRPLHVHESRARTGINRRKLGLKSPPGAIPNLGADREIKPQPRFAFAMRTCGLASQPTCPDRETRPQRAAR
jgi:hypothetical protein